jgi:hypothetical protein
LLEAGIRQAWEGYKNKNKEAFACIFTDDAIEVEERAEGAHDKKATLVEIEYIVRPAGEMIHNKSMIGEVLGKDGGRLETSLLARDKIK